MISYRIYYDSESSSFAYCNQRKEMFISKKRITETLFDVQKKHFATGAILCYIMLLYFGINCNFRYFPLRY